MDPPRSLPLASMVATFLFANVGKPTNIVMPNNVFLRTNVFYWRDVQQALTTVISPLGAIAAAMTDLDATNFAVVWIDTGNVSISGRLLPEQT